MVKKSNGKWRMCVDFTDLNKACPKDAYPLPCIDTFVDNSCGYGTLSFMDAYSGYSKILMHPSDQEKIAFITEYALFLLQKMTKFNSQFILQIIAKCQASLPEVRKAHLCASLLRKYQPRGSIKSQYLADFVAEFTKPYSEAGSQEWSLFVDGASNPQGSGAGILLESPEGIILEHSLRFSFKASNNQAEYETLIAGIRRGYSRPLLKCLDRSEDGFILAEAHEGICGIHSGTRSLAQKILRAGFYWPTLWEDSRQKVKTCDNCQKHALIINVPAEHLHHLVINQHFSSVEHPQSNGLAKAANKVLLQALRKKLDNAKGLWAELVPEILRAYNTTVHSTTETPFRLVYGSEAMIPIEISQDSLRTQAEHHDQARRAELDLIEEMRNTVAIRHRALQQQVGRRHDKRVHLRSFNVGDLVLRKTEEAHRPSSHGKLATARDSPYRVHEVLRRGAYKLEQLNGTKIPNTWNVNSLKQYYS
ncbi:uncharacterized protein [Arachis hypogaea]|uniref:uncharacterized protein n=1 Tax=Arachis hypogaea TaxID=3818 RepID=UPI003B21FEFE